MYSSVGYREEQRIDVSLWASRDGRLIAMHVIKTAPTCSFGDWIEPSWYPFSFMYACPNLEASCRLLPANLMSATFTRAPGEAPGMFVQESVLNELAAKLKTDPIQIRLDNHADVYPIDGSPWSSKRLKDCYSRGAQIVGWAERSAKPGSVRDGDWLIGMGMASASHTVYRQNAYARIAIRGDGAVHASSGASDIGTGTVTFMRQLAAEEFGLSIEMVTASIGETHLRDACQQAGASLAASLGSAILNGCRLLKAKIISMATEVADSPLRGCDPLSIQFENGCIRDTLSKKSEKISRFLRRNGLTELIQDGGFEPGRLGEVRTGDETRDRGAGHRGMHSWGAVFAKVAVDRELGLIRLRRLTGVYACGRILNPLLAKSQLIGGITWGVSQALFESSYLDRRIGRFANANLAEYMVPVNLDIPTIEVEFLPDPDPYINPAGVKGVGEIGITGVAAAIVDAVWNATGKRLRDLPITPESLL
jgi:xanthine dehydrogenase YagR molybdenum-binding subunit